MEVIGPFAGQVTERDDEIQAVAIWNLDEFVEPWPPLGSNEHVAQLQKQRDALRITEVPGKFPKITEPVPVWVLSVFWAMCGFLAGIAACQLWEAFR